MAEDIDTSPQSEAQPDAQGPDQVVAESPGDGYGSISNTAGTPNVRVCPPKLGRFTRIHTWLYDNAATAHTVTLMVPLERVLVSTDAESGQAVIRLNKMPIDSTGNLAAASDWIVVKDEQGIFGAYRISSISGLAVTIAVSIGTADGSGFTYKVPAGNVVWFFGAPADHAKRQYTMKASVVTSMPPAASGWATTPNSHEPILVHDDNGTNAGTIVGVNFSNPVV